MDRQKNGHTMTAYRALV